MQKPTPVSEQWLALIDDDVVPIGQFHDANAALAVAAEMAGPDGSVDSVWPPEVVAELIAFWSEQGVRIIH
mgnify:FL=1